MCRQKECQGKASVSGLMSGKGSSDGSESEGNTLCFGLIHFLLFQPQAFAWQWASSRINSWTGTENSKRHEPFFLSRGTVVPIVCRESSLRFFFLSTLSSLGLKGSHSDRNYAMEWKKKKPWFSRQRAGKWRPCEVKTHWGGRGVE